MKKILFYTSFIWVTVVLPGKSFAQKAKQSTSNENIIKTDSTGTKTYPLERISGKQTFPDFMDILMIFYKKILEH